MFVRNCLYYRICINLVGLAKEVFLPATSLSGPATFRAQVLSLCFEDSGNPPKMHIHTQIVNIHVSF